MAVAVMVIAAACTASSGTSTTAPRPSTQTTVATAPATDSTQPPVATTQASTTTTTTELAAPTSFEYVVVAEESSRRLAVLDPTEACIEEESQCEVVPITTVSLPERPHNLTGVGSVVYATHPAAGSMSRVDLATGDVTTSRVGVEPHDVTYVPALDALYVADEDGRKLLTIDPVSLEVLKAVELPAKPHDFAVAGDAIWVTLISRSDLARVSGEEVALVPTGGSPHDLIVDPAGLVWFSNWNSDVLNIFDPSDDSTEVAPAGVSQPHHFAIGPEGFVWVSDNGGSSIVGFTGDAPISVEVGSTPHHIVVVGDVMAVAVSGSGEAVFVADGRVVGRAPLSEGLHGVAVVVMEDPIAPTG